MRLGNTKPSDFSPLKRGLPKTIKTDRPRVHLEVDGQVGVRARRRARLRSTRQATDNALVAGFNGRLRQECLNASWFMSLEDARAKIAAWRT